MNDINIKVKTKFLLEESKLYNEYIWTYFITISNTGFEDTQLLSRHWKITDGENKTNDIIGEGVVGVQPIIKSEQSFEYNSFVALKTPNGIMSGNYTMLKNVKKFIVLIPHFYLQTNIRI